MAATRQDDRIQSVADALQYISYYHPIDFSRHWARPTPPKSRRRRKTRSRRSSTCHAPTSTSCSR
jgi:hypothetical protein